MDAEGIPVFTKFFPNLPVLFASTCESFDAASLLHGVERGEVAEFHGQAVGCASHFLGGLDDDGIARVELAELQFAVQVHGDEQLLASPFNGGCFGHKARMRKVGIFCE